MQKLLYLLVVFIPVSFIAVRIVISRVSSPPQTLGITDNQLAPCPESPNCVSSLESRASHQTEPLEFNGSLEEARKALITILENIPGSQLESVEDKYIHATFHSRMMGFVDDGEFLFDEENRLIHMRMAARLGWEDFDANLKRAEQIRTLFAQIHQ